MKPRTHTRDDIRAIARHFGLTARRQDGIWRIAPLERIARLHGTDAETLAYYTDDSDDAYNTAIEMGHAIGRE